MAERATELEGRLDNLTARIDRLRAELAQGMEPETVERIMELGSILHRHREITRAARSGEPAADRMPPQAADELAADLEVVEETLRGWIARRESRQRH